ncbi:hypothetical protein TBLA_0H00600 [Henningerozyma blattae CBS 6284]|uniref:Protein IFH1 n=1 Tax=Henningerozyma blattae (strain ATCC 34711 / CBS 6284 / DSM 70876 / NBRC 10599 / NRRL Y-10934 / UCD 77-7) TaxID=1071380 RepID=I2H7J9_HENB6|nr:hypothetical protein TBLA_0H00600 [Tetrapisispora blattae CBS 6284]CCH62351.1 hypothetical protein TBLA_0H00600 [Tetrapisispora blattae CBS 6284]
MSTGKKSPRKKIISSPSKRQRSGKKAIPSSPYSPEAVSNSKMTIPNDTTKLLGSKLSNKHTALGRKTASKSSLSKKPITTITDTTHVVSDVDVTIGNSIQDEQEELNNDDKNEKFSIDHSRIANKSILDNKFLNNTNDNRVATKSLDNSTGKQSKLIQKEDTPNTQQIAAPIMLDNLKEIPTSSSISTLRQYTEDDDYDKVTSETESSKIISLAENNATPKNEAELENNTLQNSSTSSISKDDSDVYEDISDIEVDVDNSSDDSSEDEEDSGDDRSSIYSSDSSEDENMNFVKLRAQRKKKAMKALSVMKRNNAPMKSSDSYINSSPSKAPIASSLFSDEINDSEHKNQQHLMPNSDIPVDTTEDIGEEVHLDDSKMKRINNTIMNSDSDEDSDYNIDQDEYFNAIDNDNEAVSSNETDNEHTGLETGDDDDSPILDEETKNIVTEFRSDDELSFDGSVHEQGSDPDDWDMTSSDNSSKSQEDEEEGEILSNVESIYTDDYNVLQLNGMYEDDIDDENEEDNEGNSNLMMELTMPFYEDSKFSNLYYYEDGTEPRLGLSTQLPKLLNDDKIKKIRRIVAKKKENEEIKERRKLLKETRKKNKKSLNDDGNDYIFGVFFHSDDSDMDDKETIYKVNHDSNFLNNNVINSNTYNSSAALTSSVNNMHFEKDYESSNDDNILMDEARLASDDESDDNSSKISSQKNYTPRIDTETVSSSSDSISLTLADIDDEISSDEFSSYDVSDVSNDNGAISNVFVDIDDLDPDSFYFNLSDGESSSSVFSDNDSGVKLMSTNDSHERPDSDENIVYVDDETTDEDTNLPPPEARNKSIGTKAKEIVSANVVGLKPPKLGTWDTENKPFSIIDGLSTKSLYPLIQEYQQLMKAEKSESSNENDTNAGTPNENSQYAASSTHQDGDELTLNELLNMSELDDDEEANIQSLSTSDWYKRPKVPLSAFRNKGASNLEDEFLLPANSTRKVPIGYIGNDKTRRRIDKIKEKQRKESEKRRKIKKKKKLLKLKRERDRKEKQRLQDTIMTPVALSTENSLLLGDQNNLFNPTEFGLGNLNDSIAGNPQGQDDINNGLSNNLGLSTARKESIKGMGIEDIHKLLGENNGDTLLDLDTDNDNDHSNLGGVVAFNGESINSGNLESIMMTNNNQNGSSDAEIMLSTDADILASLTAPVRLEDFDEENGSMWRRRHSIVEAAGENMRFTKNGVFSENALADLEGILGTTRDNTTELAGNVFDLSEVIQ